jgi:hypothetical protein
VNYESVRSFYLRRLDDVEFSVTLVGSDKKFIANFLLSLSNNEVYYRSVK